MDDDGQQQQLQLQLRESHSSWIASSLLAFLQAPRRSTSVRLCDGVLPPPPHLVCSRWRPGLPPEFPPTQQEYIPRTPHTSIWGGDELAPLRVCWAAALFVGLDVAGRPDAWPSSSTARAIFVDLFPFDGDVCMFVCVTRAVFACTEFVCGIQSSTDDRHRAHPHSLGWVAAAVAFRAARL